MRFTTVRTVSRSMEKALVLRSQCAGYGSCGVVVLPDDVGVSTSAPEGSIRIRMAPTAPFPISRALSPVVPLVIPLPRAPTAT